MGWPEESFVPWVVKHLTGRGGAWNTALYSSFLNITKIQFEIFWVYIFFEEQALCFIDTSNCFSGLYLIYFCSLFSFPLLTLGLICSFYSSLRYKVRLFEIF